MRTHHHHEFLLSLNESTTGSDGAPRFVVLNRWRLHPTYTSGRSSCVWSDNHQTHDGPRPIASGKTRTSRPTSASGRSKN